MLNSVDFSVYISTLSIRRRNDFQAPDFPNAAKPWQMRTKLKVTAQTSDWFNVSDRATAAIASSAL